MREEETESWLYKQLNGHALRKREATGFALLLRKRSIELFGGTSTYWVQPLRGYSLSLASYLTTADSLPRKICHSTTTGKSVMYCKSCGCCWVALT